jgi:hypothetical protein
MKFFRLPFFGMAILLFLNSCERHSVIEPLDPHQDLKQWYAFHKMTTTHEPVLWEYTTPFAMPDSSQAYQIPVMSKAGMKDLIIYSENGVLKGFYKLYTPKDETHISIQVLNMFDEVIRDGVLSKTKRVAKAKKNKELDGSSTKMANLELEEVFCYGLRIRPLIHDDLINTYRNNLGNYDSAVPAFFEGGGGDSGAEEEEINFDPSEELLFSVGNDVKNNCLLQAINGIINSKYDLGGIVKDLKLNSKTVHFIEVTNLPSSVIAQTISYSSKEVTIELNLNVLPKLSQELMAVTLYHELLHAYFGVILGKNWSESKEHDEMTDNKYLNLLESIIIKRFPNSKDFADELIFAGLQNSSYFTSLYDSQKNYANRVIENFKNGTNGTYCK